MFRSSRRLRSPALASLLPPVRLNANYYVGGEPVASFAAVSASCTSLVVVAHGLLGSARNWNSTARLLSKRLAAAPPPAQAQNDGGVGSGGGVTVACLDMRNHGLSPHVAEHSQAAMASDIDAFVADCARECPALARVGFVGHSMGGSSVMRMLSGATEAPAQLPAVARLARAAVVVDICPDTRPALVFGNIGAVFEGMAAIKIGADTTFTSAEAELRRHVKDPTLRQFILTNFVPRGNTEPMPRWRCNFPVLYEEVISFRLFNTSAMVHDVARAKIAVPTLFVFGADSPYNSADGRSRIPEYFSNARQEVLAGAGHYVHVEKQDTFTALASDFLRGLL